MMLLMADRWKDGLDSPHVGGIGFNGLCVLCCFALEERLESAEEDVSDDVLMMVEVDGSRCAKTYCSG